MLNIGGFVGSILVDLSKAQDCLKDDLLLPKREAYDFSKESKKLFLSCLTNRTRRIKIGSTFSDCTNIVKGVLLGSILGPLLLIFLSIIFSFSQQNAKSFFFTDDNSLYSCGVDNTFTNLKQDM